VSLARLFEPDADLVLAPGRAAGTNAFVCRHPAFRVDYHGTSFADHQAIARDIGAEVVVVDSHRLATDVDERGDLVEVLVHGEGTRTAAWLRERGIELAVEDGRVGVRRP
jgi:2-phospho-L-lactate guanylyltransferase